MLYEAQLRDEGCAFYGSAVLYEQMVHRVLSISKDDSGDLIAVAANILVSGPAWFAYLTDKISRLDKWAEFSQQYLKGKRCFVCGSSHRLVAHHVKPFHFGDELQTSGLIPLCESRMGCNCHLTFGHYGDWRFTNPSAYQDATGYGTGYREMRRVCEENGVRL